MKKPLVSIVIPVYNGSDYLRKAVDSALAQTYENVEVIVINDGSSDGGATESIALSYGERIRYFSKPNGGVASALNAGISQMKGEYLSWLSHDDEYLPNKIEAQIDFLATLGKPDAVLYSDFQTIDSGSRPLDTCILPAIDPGEFRLWITKENRLHGCTLLVPRACLNRSGPFNISLRTTQDYALWFRMAKTFPFIRVPEVLVNARVHEKQGTRFLGATVIEECNTLLAGFLDDLAENELAPPMPPEKRLEHLIAIARSFQARKFEVAYAHARNAAMAASREIGLVEQITTHVRLSAMRRLYRWANRKAERFLKRAKKAGRKVLGFEGNVGRRFSKMFNDNTFNSPESRSGEGSTLEQTKIIRKEIPKLLADLNVRSMIDAPCGDFHWMRVTELGVESYLGVDIVEPLIRRDNELYASAKTSFAVMNIIKENLPRADLVLCRDCLVHLTFKQGMAAIRNFKKSGSCYLLMTTFVDRRSNADLLPGDIWRTLNMCLSPFSFPEPLRLINEGCTEAGGQFKDKSLGLWRLEDLLAGD